MKFHDFNVQCQNYAPCARTLNHRFGAVRSVAVYVSAWRALSALTIRSG